MKNDRNNKNNDPELNPYGIDKLANIKPGVKIGFLKFWMVGATFLLTHMTPQLTSQDGSTEKLAMLLILTLLVEYVLNNIIIWMNNSKRPTYQYLPFGYINRKSIKSLAASLLYSLIMMLVTFYAIIRPYQLLSDALGIPTLSWVLHGDNDSLDPITFAFAFLLADYLWFLGKKVILHFIKKKNDEQKPNK